MRALSRRGWRSAMHHSALRMLCPGLAVSLLAVAVAIPAHADPALTYDGNGNLTSAIWSSGVQQSYSYDGSGNRTGESLSVPTPVIIATNKTDLNLWNYLGT